MFPQLANGVTSAAERCERPISTRGVGSLQVTRPGVVALIRNKKKDRGFAANDPSRQQHGDGQNGCTV